MQKPYLELFALLRPFLCVAAAIRLSTSTAVVAKVQTMPVDTVETKAGSPLRIRDPSPEAAVVLGRDGRGKHAHQRNTPLPPLPASSALEEQVLCAKPAAGNQVPARPGQPSLTDSRNAQSTQLFCLGRDLSAVSG